MPLPHLPHPFQQTFNGVFHLFNFFLICFCGASSYAASAVFFVRIRCVVGATINVFVFVFCLRPVRTSQEFFSLGRNAFLNKNHFLLSILFLRPMRTPHAFFCFSINAFCFVKMFFFMKHLMCYEKCLHSYSGDVVFVSWNPLPPPKPPPLPTANGTNPKK